ncbi:MAG: FAD:protein FMN transferase, partial [Burkholderiaceae bacterium]
GLGLDLSAIAKGHGVDRVAILLGRLGFESHLVEVGGELRGTGIKPDGQPWWVALERPSCGGLPGTAAPSDESGRDPNGRLPATLVALHGLSAATSGDYRRWFEHDGVRYSHTIDPRDGRPVRHGLASVTVLHADCMTADALSTALTVMGPSDGPDFAERQAIAALFVVRGRDGLRERMTSAFEAMSR